MWLHANIKEPRALCLKYLKIGISQNTVKTIFTNPIRYVVYVRAYMYMYVARYYKIYVALLYIAMYISTKSS